VTGSDSAPPEGVIRVLVVDDHPLAHLGLRQILEAFPGLELAGEARSGEEALAACRRRRPDVVIMDLLMPGLGGVEATRRLRSEHPGLRVLVLTSSEEGDLVEQALRAGAAGYLLKTASAFDVAQAVRAAHAGRSVVAPEATAALAQAMLRQEEATPGGALSVREREVLRLMARGLSNEQIGDRMSIARGTVKYHVRNVFAKLGVASRREAIALAHQRGLAR
jgi:DNA-binding NarL/FixJ family response regulator